MQEIIAASILFLISLVILWLSIRSFMEKGFLFNNAYIWASKQERESMDKKPHYRQSAVIFLLIGLVFLLNGIAVLLHIAWIFYIVIAIIIIALVYTVISSIAIERKNQQK
ncbi:MAG: DUF3784 domain-containing protein [Oscillospiraceae bacterium]|nr:DUF3784 domain-containing protein [Oscillospiraceae bacterium]MBR6618258.1 DUF3784 domain-containing protein [Oscillospiraceae bacterium]